MNYQACLLLRTFALLILALTLFSCSREKSPSIPEEKILAKVGERIITSDEFRYSYEFCLAPLKRGDNPRRIYLDHMINELLLANEGYRLDLHKHPYVTKKLSRRRINDLTESFLVKHVHGKIKISEEELHDAIKKSTVTFRMIILPEPSLKKANEIADEAEKSNLENYIEEQLKKQELPLDTKKFYETDWMDFLEMPPAIFAHIKSLEIGKASRPFPYGDGYAVAQILDIHRKGITTSELMYGPKRKKAERRLHSIKAAKILSEVTDSVMTPLDVRVKNKTVVQLAKPLYQWFQDSLPQGRSIFKIFANPPDTVKDYVHEIKGLFDETLLTYKNGSKSVEDYLYYMDYYRKALKENKSFEDFTARLITEIGSMMRQETFIKIAENDGFSDSLKVTEDLRVWEQKWTYELYRHEVVKDIDITPEELNDYFSKRWRELGIADLDTSQLNKYADEVYNAVFHEKQLEHLSVRLTRIKEQYPVWINEELLNQIKLTDADKPSNISLFVRKTLTAEPVVPVVDDKWIN